MRFSENMLHEIIITGIVGHVVGDGSRRRISIQESLLYEGDWYGD